MSNRLIRISSPVGIFDSGVGGLTVAKEIRRLLPNESTVYVGDTARVPYGTKSTETLLSYGREIIKFLQTKNVKAVVLACGTSGATTFDTLQAEFPNLPLIDVLRPGVEICAKKPDAKFGIIATSGTIKSGMFAKLLAEKLPDAILYSRACPLFASMVEAGLAIKPNNPILRFAAETYLEDLRGKIDTLILGCTHYPLLTDILRQVLGDVDFINLAEATALAAKDAIGNMLADNLNPTHEFYVSGSEEVFRKTALGIFGEDCKVFKLSHVQTFPLIQTNKCGKIYL